ncbi:hypothetical protein ZHAS_00010797 [Anopheles sinensis]|uniref:Uncharacterized protein n=1 Tax=Anopheles sinensis TaxID=74873 RepID=A0A084VY85_ANOSI|nr:hypothetical protein ZHAS_00010797 [Anopheles sinensis]
MNYIYVVRALEWAYNAYKRHDCTELEHIISTLVTLSPPHLPRHLGPPPRQAVAFSRGSLWRELSVCARIARFRHQHLRIWTGFRHGVGIGARDIHPASRGPASRPGRPGLLGRPTSNHSRLLGVNWKSSKLPSLLCSAAVVRYPVCRAKPVPGFGDPGRPRQVWGLARGLRWKVDHVEQNGTTGAVAAEGDSTSFGIQGACHIRVSEREGKR